MKASSLLMLAVFLGSVCCAAVSQGVFDELRGLSVAVVYGSRAAETDYRAALMLAELAAKLGCDVRVTEDSDLSKLADMSLIVVGGPAANKAAVELNFKLGVGFRYSGKRWILVVERPRRAFREPDIGLVLASKLEGRVVIWVAGIAREGTTAAARYLAEHYSEIELNSLILVRGQRALEVMSLREEAERSIIQLTVYYFYSILRRYRGPWIGADETTRIHVWCIPPSLKRGWYIVWDASPTELPIAGMYNVVWLIKEFSEETGVAVIRLGRYYQPSDGAVVAQLDRNQGLCYSIADSSYTIYWRTGFISTGVQYSIPWTRGELAFEAKPARTPGAYALYIYRRGELIACDLLADKATIEVDLGPDGEPTTLEVEVLKACPDAKCISLMFSLRARGPTLNISELGDDLDLAPFLYLLHWNGTYLFWARTQEIEVPSWLPERSHINLTDTCWLTIADPSKLGS